MSSDLVVDVGSGDVVVAATPADEVARRAAARAEGAAFDATEASRRTVRGDLHARLRQALTDNAAFLANASPTNAQTLAQVRKLTRQTNAIVRALLAVDGARDLLVESTDV